MSTFRRVKEFLRRSGALDLEGEDANNFIELFETFDDRGELASMLITVNDHLEAQGDIETQTDFQREVREYLDLRKRLF